MLTLPAAGVFLVMKRSSNASTLVINNPPIPRLEIVCALRMPRIGFCNAAQEVYYDCDMTCEWAQKLGARLTSCATLICTRNLYSLANSMSMDGISQRTW